MPISRLSSILHRSTLGRGGLSPPAANLYGGLRPARFTRRDHWSHQPARYPRFGRIVYLCRQVPPRRIFQTGTIIRTPMPTDRRLLRSSTTVDTWLVSSVAKCNRYSIRPRRPLRSASVSGTGLHPQRAPRNRHHWHSQACRPGSFPVSRCRNGRFGRRSLISRAVPDRLADVDRGRRGARPEAR